MRLAFGHRIGVPACVLFPLRPLLQHSKEEGAVGEAVLPSITGSSYSLGSRYGCRLAKATKNAAVYAIEVPSAYRLSAGACIAHHIL